MLLKCLDLCLLLEYTNELQRASGKAWNTCENPLSFRSQASLLCLRLPWGVREQNTDSFLFFAPQSAPVLLSVPLWVTALVGYCYSLQDFLPTIPTSGSGPQFWRPVGSSSHTGAQTVERGLQWVGYNLNLRFENPQHASNNVVIVSVLAQIQLQGTFSPPWRVVFLSALLSVYPFIHMSRLFDTF